MSLEAASEFPGVLPVHPLPASAMQAVIPTTSLAHRGGVFGLHQPPEGILSLQAHSGKLSGCWQLQSQQFPFVQGWSYPPWQAARVHKSPHPSRGLHMQVVLQAAVPWQTPDVVEMNIPPANSTQSDSAIIRRACVGVSFGTCSMCLFSFVKIHLTAPRNVRSHTPTAL